MKCSKIPYYLHKLEYFTSSGTCSVSTCFISGMSQVFLFGSYKQKTETTKRGFLLHVVIIMSDCRVGHYSRVLWKWVGVFVLGEIIALFCVK